MSSLAVGVMLGQVGQQQAGGGGGSPPPPPPSAWALGDNEPTLLLLANGSNGADATLYDTSGGGRDFELSGTVQDEDYGGGKYGITSSGGGSFARNDPIIDGTSDWTVGVAYTYEPDTTGLIFKFGSDSNGLGFGTGYITVESGGHFAITLFEAIRWGGVTPDMPASGTAILTIDYAAGGWTVKLYLGGVYAGENVSNFAPPTTSSGVMGSPSGGRPWEGTLHGLVVYQGLADSDGRAALHTKLTALLPEA